MKLNSQSNLQSYFYSDTFKSSQLFKDICKAIVDGDHHYIFALCQQNLIPPSPYWISLACSVGDVQLVSFFINKVQMPISDDIYLAESHSLHACNFGSLECLLLLKVALVPLPSVEKMLCQVTHHCSLMHEGHLEIFEYLLTTYPDHPAFFKHSIADYNINRFIGLLLPENVQVIVWASLKGYNVSMYQSIVEEVLTESKLRIHIPIVSDKTATQMIRPKSPARELDQYMLACFHQAQNFMKI